MRRFRSRPMGRRSGVRPVIQSFKKVLFVAPASRAAATSLNQVLTEGEDSIAAGQTGATDAGVPTGSMIKYIEIQYAVTNLVAIASHMTLSIQRTHSGQAPIVSNAIGGSPQRNQVHLMKMYNIGQNQNSNHTIRFKVPAKYQRVREGDKWQINRVCDTVFTDAILVIYKFYR